jgi:hypothetical protein
MSNLVKDFNAGRWYDEHGNIVNFVPSKDNSKMIKATLREARGLKLKPSITTVLGLLRNEGLENWTKEQLILACLTLPIQAGENSSDYAKRVLQDSKAYTEQAANEGSEIHEIIENIILKQDVFVTEKYKKLQQEATVFVKNNKIVGAVEIATANKFVGGRVDFFGKYQGKKAIIDWKSQVVKNNKPVFYDNWSWQLAGYASLLNQSTNIQWLNVVICRDTQDIYTKVWELKEKQRARRIFNLLVKLFYEIKELGGEL